MSARAQKVGNEAAVWIFKRPCIWLCDSESIIMRAYGTPSAAAPFAMYLPTSHSFVRVYFSTYLPTYARPALSYIPLSLPLASPLYILYEFQCARAFVNLPRPWRCLDKRIYAVHFVAARDDFNRRAGLFFRQINGPRVYYQAFRCSGDSRYGPTQCEVLCQSIRKMLAADSVCILIVRRMLCYAHACILSFLIKRTRICICVCIYIGSWMGLYLYLGIIQIPVHFHRLAALIAATFSLARGLITHYYQSPPPRVPLTTPAAALESYTPPA